MGSSPVWEAKEEWNPNRTSLTVLKFAASGPNSENAWTGMIKQALAHGRVEILYYHPDGAVLRATFHESNGALMGGF